MITSFKAFVNFSLTESALWLKIIKLNHRCVAEVLVAEWRYAGAVTNILGWELR
jgi:hypothetical protein